MRSGRSLWAPST